MSVPSNDYNNNMGASSCSYANLGNYNAGYSMEIAPQGKVISGKMIVPTWSPISYDSLSGSSSCSGYPSIVSAYGADASACQTTYRSSLCGGGNPDQ